jgi:hypothetical protein
MTALSEDSASSDAKAKVREDLKAFFEAASDDDKAPFIGSLKLLANPDTRFQTLCLTLVGSHWNGLDTQPLHNALSESAVHFVCAPLENATAGVLTKLLPILEGSAIAVDDTEGQTVHEAICELLTRNLQESQLLEASLLADLKVTLKTVYVQYVKGLTGFVLDRMEAAGEQNLSLLLGEGAYRELMACGGNPPGGLVPFLDADGSCLDYVVDVVLQSVSPDAAYLVYKSSWQLLHMGTPSQVRTARSGGDHLSTKPVAAPRRARLAEQCSDERARVSR